MSSCAILYIMVLKITMFFDIYAVTLLSLELSSKVLCRRLSLKLCVDRVFKQKYINKALLPFCLFFLWRRNYMGKFILSLDRAFDNTSPLGLCMCIVVFLQQMEGENVLADCLIFTQRACPDLILSVVEYSVHALCFIWCTFQVCRGVHIYIFHVNNVWILVLVSEIIIHTVRNKVLLPLPSVFHYSQNILRK